MTAEEMADKEIKKLETEIDRLKVELYHLSKHNTAIIIDNNEQRAQLRERDECIEKLSAALLIYETADAESRLETSILSYDAMKAYVTLKKEMVAILTNSTPNPEVSDTTKGDSSKEAGKQKEEIEKL
jgi:hypothetical protein